MEWGRYRFVKLAWLCVEYEDLAKASLSKDLASSGPPWYPWLSPDLISCHLVACTQTPAT